jgi:hypothetical protein
MDTAEALSPKSTAIASNDIEYQNDPRMYRTREAEKKTA